MHIHTLGAVYCVVAVAVAVMCLSNTAEARVHTGGHSSYNPGMQWGTIEEESTSSSGAGHEVHGVLEGSVSTDTDDDDHDGESTHKDKPHAYTPSKKKAADSLRITKRVNGAKTNERFIFTLSLTDADGCALKSKYRWTRFGKRDSSKASGRIGNNGTVRVGRGETVGIEGIPDGTKYRVVEEDYSGTDYVLVSAKGDTGTIKKGKTAKAIFTNAVAKEEADVEDAKDDEIAYSNSSSEVGAGFVLGLLIVTVGGSVVVYHYRLHRKR